MPAHAGRAQGGSRGVRAWWALTFYLNRSIYVCKKSKVRRADPTHNEVKMKLAEIYEILNEPRKALELVYEGLSIFLSLCYFTLLLTESTYTPPVIDSRKKRPKESAGQNHGHQTSEDPSGTSLFEEK